MRTWLLALSPVPVIRTWSSAARDRLVEPLIDQRNLFVAVLRKGQRHARKEVRLGWAGGAGARSEAAEFASGAVHAVAEVDAAARRCEFGCTQKASSSSVGRSGTRTANADVSCRLAVLVACIDVGSWSRLCVRSIAPSASQGLVRPHGSAISEKNGDHLIHAAVASGHPSQSGAVRRSRRPTASPEWGTCAGLRPCYCAGALGFVAIRLPTARMKV